MNNYSYHFKDNNCYKMNTILLLVSLKYLIN